MVPDKIITLAQQAVVKIPVKDNGETLVDLTSIAGIMVDDRKFKSSANFSKVRKTVADKLVLAQKELPSDCRLLIIEGHRPISLQTEYFKDYSDELRNKYPNWDEQQIYQEACKYVSPPEIVPPHSTGGAVDLTLAKSTGVEVDMGVPVNATPEESDNACYTRSTNISKAAKLNRQILIHAMAYAGFVNYPSEFWHWSYGDKYWAYWMKQAYSSYDSL